MRDRSGSLARQFAREHHQPRAGLRADTAVVLVGLVVAARVIGSAEGGVRKGELKT